MLICFDFEYELPSNIQTADFCSDHFMGGNDFLKLLCVVNHTSSDELKTSHLNFFQQF